jgi:hypothetical protein
MGTEAARHHITHQARTSMMILINTQMSAKSGYPVVA